MENNSPWRSVLSIVLLIVALVRIVMFCNRQNSTPNYNSDQQIQNMMQSQQETMQRVQEAQAVEAPKQLYIPYASLKDTEDIVLINRGIERVAKDTLMPFDLTTSLKIDKGTMMIRRPQSPIRFGFKGANDVMTWINDYTEKGSISELLGASRPDLKITKEDKSSERTKQIFYTYTHEGQKINGFGVCTSEESGTIAMLFEHEKKSSAQLQTEFMTFVLTHFVKVTDDQSSTAQ
ncbi:MAG: hypothetical protein RLZZ500_1791 [Bacteroidota bacterium]|jgi:hypothetical protein